MQIRLLYKKFLCVFMSLMIVIFSTQSAYATTSVGGWAATDSLIAGANTTINAVKTASGKALKSSITVAASASKVGKYLIKGGGQAALAYAVIEILGEGIDWVLDPANNAIKYKDTADNPSSDPNSPRNKYLWTSVRGGAKSSPAESCESSTNSAGGGWSHTGVKMISETKYECWGAYNSGVPQRISDSNRSNNPFYSSGAGASSDEYKYISIDSVAAKVIANAEAGHAPSQEAVKATALEGFGAGEHDAALDAAAVPDTGVENPPDTENPPADTPFDPSSILSALGSIAAVLAGIMSALTDFVDWWQAQWLTFSTAITDFNTWVRAEPDAAALEDEPVPVSEGTLIDGWQDKANAGYVNLGVGAQCPSDVLIPMSYMGASTNLAISYVPFCHFASIIRYAVIMGAWIAALMIISGGRTRE